MNPMMQSDSLKGTGDRFVDLARSDDQVKYNACLSICGKFMTNLEIQCLR